MLLSNGTEVTIKYFLDFVKMQSLDISPAIIMTDCNKAQMNVIMATYPGTMVLLSLWAFYNVIQFSWLFHEI